MQYKPTRSLCATVAIAATLALGSTTGFAQEAAPVVSVPPAAPAPAITAPPPVSAAPTVAIPPVTVQPTAPQPEAAAAEPAPAPARAEPAPRQAAAAPAAGAPAAATPADTAPAVPAAVPPESALQTPLDTAELDTAEPAPVIQAPAPAAEADTGGLTGEEVGFLALLAAIGLGGIAFLVMGMRRRRRTASEVEVHDYTPEPAVTGLQQPVVMTETPVRANPVYDVADHPAQPAMASPTMTAPRSAPTEAFAMGSGPFPTDDRQHLIDRMVAAEPDEANPFTSRKARRRRARLLLQARENGQPGDAAKPFDWRSYEPSRRREPSELMPA